MPQLCYIFIFQGDTGVETENEKDYAPFHARYAETPLLKHKEHSAVLK